MLSHVSCSHLNRPVVVVLAACLGQDERPQNRKLSMQAKQAGLASLSSSAILPPYRVPWSTHLLCTYTAAFWHILRLSSGGMGNDRTARGDAAPKAVPITAPSLYRDCSRTARIGPGRERATDPESESESKTAIHTGTCLFARRSRKPRTE